MLCSYRDKTYTGFRPKRGHLENAKIKDQSAKLRNPGLAGMGVLVVASFSISRILHLLDGYYIRLEVGCQVKFLTTKARREPQISQINSDLTDLGIRAYKCMRMYLWSASTAEGFGPLPKRFFSPDDYKALTCDGHLLITPMKQIMLPGCRPRRLKRGSRPPRYAPKAAQMPAFSLEQQR